MSKPIAWILIASGVLMDAIVLFSPLTPYPVIQFLLEPDYLTLKTGYEAFLDRGTWQNGDTGFDLARHRYMEDVVEGTRPPLDPEHMLGTRLDMFRLDEEDRDPPTREAQKVFVIYSNQQGHIVNGSEIKRLILAYRSDYTALVYAALILVGTVLIYAGFRRILDPTASNSAVYAPGTPSLSRNTAS